MIRRHGNPVWLGLFVVLALGLLFVTVFTVAGGKLFTRKQQVVMHFAGSIYGLQVGAPVVFRGVRLGNVSSIGVRWDDRDREVSIPVVAELESEVIASVGGRDRGDDPSQTVPLLVERGLRAQLAMQSILTGQLYIDLDFRPGKAAQAEGGAQRYPEIPTVSTAMQNLRNQVDQLDIQRLIEDVGVIASTTRSLVTSPDLARAVAQLDDITQHLSHLSDQMDRRAGPLVDRSEATLEAVRSAAERMGAAAGTVSQAATRVGTTFNPEGPLVSRLRQTADELTRTATQLGDGVGPNAPLQQDLQRALQDLASAARSLRELADTLHQQPESVLRGRH